MKSSLGAGSAYSRNVGCLWGRESRASNCLSQSSTFHPSKHCPHIGSPGSLLVDCQLIMADLMVAFDWLNRLEYW